MANKLILSYLRHSLCSHLISYAAVFKGISKYEGFDKHQCVIALLEFLESIMEGVTCRGKTEESVLPNAVISVFYWLMKVVLSCLEIPRGKDSLNEQQVFILNKTSIVLEKFSSNQFLMSVLFLGKIEDMDLYSKVTRTHSEIKNKFDSTKFVPINNIEELLKNCAFINIKSLDMVQLESNEVESITFVLQPLLAIEVLLNPSSDTQIYVAELLMIQRLKGYSMPRLYSEIMRACLISLYNVSGTSRESMWCAFTFIKIPHILKQIHIMSIDYDEKMDYSPDIIEAFEMLLSGSPIIDLMDTKCSCNTVECLLNEMMKQNLVNEESIKHFADKRDAVTNNLQKLETHNSQPSIVKFVIRAEPPLAGILKTLSTDYNKVQEALLSMLCQVLSGNSFELILSVATVEGKLKTFVSRLIKCNECSKQVPGESPKLAAIRSALFDVSFLMLTSIVQTYGSDVVLEENGDTFFEKWVRDCMVERNKCKSPINMIKLCEQSKVDELLLHLNATEGSPNKITSLKYHEVCNNIPGMLYNVLIAWENETLSTTDVKIILDSMKSRLCSFSVCAASWLCAYMQIVRQDLLLKPMNMVQQFLTALSSEEISQQENYHERLGLTMQIIRKMQHDFNPKMRALMLTQNIVSATPLENQFNEVWTSIADRGWVPIEAAQILESLLNSCGPLWLVTKLVSEIFKCKYVQDMTKTMDIVFAIMHLDIEKCTVALLSQLLPSMLLNKLQNINMIDPPAKIFARLCVYSILATIEIPAGPTKKRSRNLDSDEIENMPPALKTRKLNAEGDSSSNDFILDSILFRKPPTTVKEPLQKCLKQLFKMFFSCSHQDDVSPKVYFIFHFLSLLVECGKDRCNSVLKLLPAGLVQNLLKIISIDEFTVGLILRLHDFSTQTGRLAAMTDLCMFRNIQLRKESINL